MSDSQVLIDFFRQYEKENGTEKTVDYVCRVLQAAGIVDPKLSCWREATDESYKYAVLFPIEKKEVLSVG